MNLSRTTILACTLAAVAAGPDAFAQDGDSAAVHAAVTQRDAWAVLDVDGDARLSAEEVSVDAALSARFAAIDADGDGFLDADEYRAGAHSTRVAEASATGAAHAAAHSAVAVRATWADLDADGDGRISLAEASADGGFDATFGDLDADGDGFVTRAEFRADARADRVPPR